MATMMLMEWAGVTPKQYEHVFSALGLDTEPAAGLIFHVTGFSGATMHVLDVWESMQAFEQFQHDRLMAAVQGAHIATQPKVQMMPVHNVYLPDPDAILRHGGASSLPSIL